MKKTLLIVSVAVFGLSFGCGGGKDAKDKPATAADTPNTAATATAVVPDTAGGAAATATSTTTADCGGGNAGIVWDTAANYVFTSDSGGNILAGIAWGANRFVAVGFNFRDFDESDSTFGLIAYSSDGKTWTMVKNTTFGGIPSSIHTIVWGGDKFVAGGDDGKMAYSPDGINWTAVKNSAFGDNHISAIVWNGNRFVAVGGTTVIWGKRDSKNRSKLAYSPDGVTWTAVTNNPFDTSKIQCLAWGNNKFVAVGRVGKMAYSPDGITWTAAKDTILDNFIAYDIAWGKDKFVAVGLGYNVDKDKDDKYTVKNLYSPDGIVWTAMTTSPLRNNYGSYPGDQSISKIAWGNNTFIATGGDLDVTIMAYSPDGINWTPEKNPPFPDDNTHAILWVDCRFIVGSGWGKVAFSK